MTRQELVRSELMESLDHFRRAATHAAGGVGATVGPNYDMARTRVGSAREWVSPRSGKIVDAATMRWDATVAAFAPLMQAARDGAIKASKLEAQNGNGKKKAIEMAPPAEHRMSGTVMALIATGAAVGAAGALAARRRNRVKWSEYEPSQLHSDAKGLLDSDSTATTSLSSDARDMGEPGRMKKAAGWTKGQAQQAYGSMRHKIHDATADRADMGDAMGRAGEMADDARGTVRKANEHPNEGANHFGDKTKDKLNESSSQASDPANRTGDSVDDLLRSSKNGRM
jgi:hypothetical protein